MSRGIHDILSQVRTSPVIVDVGAAGGIPPIWYSMANYCKYLGFDPDLREIGEPKDYPFKEAKIINKAIVADPSVKDIEFLYTANPYCSSTLPPNTENTNAYVFASYFDVVGQKQVAATTLDKVLMDLDWPDVHWLKLDTQGTDRIIYQSLPHTIRASLLVVELEPGLLPFYQGEDTFCDIHQTLLNDGFWLQDMVVKGRQRINAETLTHFSEEFPDLYDQLEAVRRPNSWVELRYVRTVESLMSQQAEADTLLILWAFAMAMRDHGFALDVALAYRKQADDNGVFDQLKNTVVSAIRTEKYDVLPDKLRNIMPRVKHKLRRVFRRTFNR